jgi:hypothetical protein
MWQKHTAVAAVRQQLIQQVLQQASVAQKAAFRRKQVSCSTSSSSVSGHLLGAATANAGPNFDAHSELSSSGATSSSSSGGSQSSCSQSSANQQISSSFSQSQPGSCP